MANRMDWNKAYKGRRQFLRFVAKDQEKRSKLSFRGPHKERTPQFLIDRHNGNIEAASEDYKSFCVKKQRERQSNNAEEARKRFLDRHPPE